jgi:hypothetical protein
MSGSNAFKLFIPVPVNCTTLYGFQAPVRNSWLAELVLIVMSNTPQCPHCQFLRLQIYNPAIGDVK